MWLSCCYVAFQLDLKSFSYLVLKNFLNIWAPILIEQYKNMSPYGTVSSSLPHITNNYGFISTNVLAPITADITRILI